MQFLVDNNISPRLVTSLKQSNYNAVHVTDFGYILSEWKSPKPSIILFRYVSLNPDILTNILIRYINNSCYARILNSSPSPPSLSKRRGTGG